LLERRERNAAEESDHDRDEGNEGAIAKAEDRKKMHVNDSLLCGRAVGTSAHDDVPA
jgi:hypothetical protein